MARLFRLARQIDCLVTLFGGTPDFGYAVPADATQKYAVSPGGGRHPGLEFLREKNLLQ